jgi:hypothetical protein
VISRIGPPPLPPPEGPEPGANEPAADPEPLLKELLIEEEAVIGNVEESFLAATGFEPLGKTTERFTVEDEED